MTEFLAADNEILSWIRSQIEDGLAEADGQAPAVANVRIDMVRDPADWATWQMPAVIIDYRNWTPGEEYHGGGAGYALKRQLPIWLVAITRGESQQAQAENRAIVERLATLAGTWNASRSAIIEEAAGRVSAIHVRGAGWTLYRETSTALDTRSCVGALALQLEHMSA